MEAYDDRAPLPEVPGRSPTEIQGTADREEGDGSTSAPRPGDEQETLGREERGADEEATGLTKEKEETGGAGEEEELATGNEGIKEEAGGGGGEGAEQTTTEDIDQEEPVEKEQ